MSQRIFNARGVCIVDYARAGRGAAQIRRLLGDLAEFMDDEIDRRSQAQLPKRHEYIRRPTELSARLHRAIERMEGGGR